MRNMLLTTLFILPHIYLYLTGNLIALMWCGYSLGAAVVIAAGIVTVRVLLKKSSDQAFKLAMLTGASGLSFLLGTSTSMALYIL